MKEYIERAHVLKFINALLDCMDIVVNAPAADVVSKDLYEQIKWERDVALAQLEEYGVSLGEKADVAEVVRCKDCRYYRAKNFPLFSGDCFYGVSGERTVFEDHYCSYGEWKMDKEE